MYEYIKVDNPKLTSKSLFTRNSNSIVNIKKVNGEVEVSIALGNDYYPAFDIKLVGDKIWSRYGLTLEEYSYYKNVLGTIRDSFPITSNTNFGDWEQRVRI